MQNAPRTATAGNEKALATVTAIIDGMGSIGAAIGPLMTGYISGALWGPCLASRRSAQYLCYGVVTDLLLAAGPLSVLPGLLLPLTNCCCLQLSTWLCRAAGRV